MDERRGWLRVVNWRPLQKYQKPNPPWIKLYTSLASDDGADSKWHARERWQSLGSAGQALLVNLWLHAAMTTTDGRIWSDREFLRGVLATDAPIDLEPLIAAGFLEWADEKGENAKRESESEGEGETEAEESPLPPKAAEAEKKESQRKSGSAPSGRTAKPQERAEPVRKPDESPRQSQSERPEPPRSAAILENRTPPCGIRSFPPESDGMGKPVPGVDSKAKGPPVRRGEGSLLGKSLPRAFREAADPVKWSWITEVYRLLRFPYPMDSPLGRQEVGSFESLYDKLMSSGLGGSARMEVLAGDLEWADKKGSKGRNRRRGAVFCSVHKQRVLTYLARDGPRR